MSYLIRASRYGWTQNTSPAQAAAPVMTDQAGVSVTLDWANSADADLAGYEVRVRRGATGAFKLLARPTASVYIDTAAIVGTNYYRVYARDTKGHLSAYRSAQQVHAAA